MSLIVTGRDIVAYVKSDIPTKEVLVWLLVSQVEISSVLLNSSTKSHNCIATNLLVALTIMKSTTDNSVSVLLDTLAILSVCAFSMSIPMLALTTVKRLEKLAFVIADMRDKETNVLSKLVLPTVSAMVLEAASAIMDITCRMECASKELLANPTVKEMLQVNVNVFLVTLTMESFVVVVLQASSGSLLRTDV